MAGTRRTARWVGAVTGSVLLLLLVPVWSAPAAPAGSDELRSDSTALRFWPWPAVAAAFLALAGVASAVVIRLDRRRRSALADLRRERERRGRIEQALRRSEELRTESGKLAAVGRLAAGVAHEINNPLTGVLTFAHLLKRKPNLLDEDREDLDVIIRETTRASDLVRSLLDFARERPAHREPLDVNAVIRRTMPLLRSQKAFRQIRIVEELAPELARVTGDFNRLQQVILSLALSACEAMPGGGRLTVRSERREETVIVSLSDSGGGIRSEPLDRISEPAFTAETSGAGIASGLAVSRRIVEEHGGTLTASRGEGEGTTFTIVLPVTHAADSETRPVEKLDA